VADGFAWAVLPTWKGRYPWKYVLATAVLILLVGLLPALVGGDSFSWVGPARWAVFGISAGVAVTLVIQGRRELVVTAGVFHGYPSLEDVTSNQVLGVEVLQHWWGSNVHVVVVGGASMPLPVMTWRFWPDAGFDDQVRGLRLALGMSPDPLPDVG
jgi:hypothetical protein